ncbi:MAG: dihydrofolate reductase [Flavobacteriales bacterium]|nr:MAG: dihydrofolate reductase [Flavobacteriales bacterium]|tara:strand:+ start:10142 stop:11044 length:903 start_codon:yes stop_codon:yes gene_type:complete
MFFKKKPKNTIDPQQVTLVEHAQQRIAQKKRFNNHLLATLFLVFFAFVLNFAFEYKADFTPFNTHWSFALAALLGVFLLIHFIKVYVFYTFMGKAWETQQMEFLLEKQATMVEKIKRSMDKEAALKASAEWEREKQQKNITMIAAVAENNALGMDNKLIWHLSDDLKRFKNLTKGHHVIMGRKTFESMPKALPNRTNVVITRQAEYAAENAHVVNTLEAALALAQEDDRPFIIGGGEIYRQGLAFANCIELTRVHDDFEADTFFPEIDTAVWREVWRENHDKDEKHAHAFSFIRYEKIDV